MADGTNGPTLWRVLLDDQGNTTQVTLPEEIPAPDGMVWRSCWPGFLFAGLPGIVWVGEAEE